MSQGHPAGIGGRIRTQTVWLEENCGVSVFQCQNNAAEITTQPQWLTRSICLAHKFTGLSWSRLDSLMLGNWLGSWWPQWDPMRWHWPSLGLTILDHDRWVRWRSPTGKVLFKSVCVISLASTGHVCLRAEWEQVGTVELHGRGIDLGMGKELAAVILMNLPQTWINHRLEFGGLEWSVQPTLPIMWFFNNYLTFWFMISSAVK